MCRALTNPDGLVLDLAAWGRDAGDGRREGRQHGAGRSRRAADYSYWAVMRDEKGRVAWSTLRLRTEDVIEAP